MDLEPQETPGDPNGSQRTRPRGATRVWKYAYRIRNAKNISVFFARHIDPFYTAEHSRTLYDNFLETYQIDLRLAVTVDEFRRGFLRHQLLWAVLGSSAIIELTPSSRRDHQDHQHDKASPSSHQITTIAFIANYQTTQNVVPTFPPKSPDILPPTRQPYLKDDSKQHRI